VTASPVESEARLKTESPVAFPGGRMEEGDEGGLYTAMRQTWEEIGLDLAEEDYLCVGQLDDREITTSLGKRLLMILTPFVFLQITHSAAAPDPSEGVAPLWTALSALTSETTVWSHVTVDIASRLAPRNSNLLRVIIRSLIGNMQFSAITLHQTGSAESETLEYPIKIWGLTLGMTLDLMARMDCFPFSAASRSPDIIPYKTAPNIAYYLTPLTYCRA